MIFVSAEISTSKFWGVIYAAVGAKISTGLAFVKIAKESEKVAENNKTVPTLTTILWMK